MTTTFGISNIGAIPPDEWATDIRSAATSSGLCAAANMGADWDFVGTEVRYMESGGFVIYQDNTATAGTRTGSTLTSNVSVLVKKRSALGGRTNQGRLYLPAAFLSPSDVFPNGNIVSSRVTDLQTDLDAFFDALDGGLFQLKIYHSDGVTSPTTITSFQVQSKVATQRRRLRP